MLLNFEANNATLTAMNYIKHTTVTRVSYSDTDQMGFMHHSKYACYYENARWQIFRAMNIPYAEIESQNILMPVIDVAFKYLKPAYYDEQLRIVTTVSLKNSVKIRFEYQMFNSKDELVNEGYVTTAFVHKDGLKPCHPPKCIAEAFEKYQQQND